MKRSMPVLTLGAVLLSAPALLFGQTGEPNPASNQQQAPAQNANGWSQQQLMQTVQQVRKRLLSLPRYSVFDSLHFGIQGHTLILQGYASRPVLKSDAANAVKGVEGIRDVRNDIQVLPNSPMDDRIRIEVYRRIYSQPALRKYTSSPVGFGRFPSVALAAGGITADPPLGYHAIHIIVDHGKVTLKGVVDSESDATIAYVQANSAPGAFSVENDLEVAGQPAKNREK